MLARRKRAQSLCLVSCARPVHRLLDPIRRLVRVLMLPCSNDSPTGFTEVCIRSPITSDVRLDLRSPPVGVGFGPCHVLGTPVPEAPVEKHCDPGTREDDVRPPTPLRRKRGATDEEPEAAAMQFPTNCYLQLRVLPWCPTQPRRRVNGGCRRSAHGSIMTCPVRLRSTGALDCLRCHNSLRRKCRRTIVSRRGAISYLAVSSARRISGSDSTTLRTRSTILASDAKHNGCNELMRRSSIHTKFASRALVPPFFP